MAERVRLAQILDEHMDDMVILGRLFELYSDQKRSRKGYQQALEELRTKEPCRCSHRLVIDWVEDVEGSRWPHACGVRRGDPERWGLESQPWAEWLGMVVTSRTVRAFAPLDILCHALYEMTWWGYSEEAVQKRVDKMIARSRSRRDDG
jgi:hypothetical protein